MAEKTSKKKILIVEDEALLAEMYEQGFVQDGGFTVFSTVTAEEGIEIAKKERPDFILLDILLPKGDGIQFLEMQKEEKEIAEIPVLVASNFDHPPTKKRADELGVLDYIIKTEYTPQQIIDLVKKHLS